MYAWIHPWVALLERFSGNIVGFDAEPIGPLVRLLVRLLFASRFSVAVARCYSRWARAPSNLLILRSFHRPFHYSLHSHSRHAF